MRFGLFFHKAAVIGFQAIGWILVFWGIGSGYYAWAEGESLRDSVLIPGLALALAGQLFTQAKYFSERRIEDSKFYLDTCIEAYDEAEKLVHDGNNERINWIASERALKVAMELAAHVTLRAHRQVLELYEVKYRRIFSLCLRKPPTFFYGVSTKTEDLDEAARLSTQGEDKHGLSNISQIQAISETSLLTFWRAARWPDKVARREMESNEIFSTEDLEKLRVLYPEMHQFIEHTRRYRSFAGALSPREKN